MSKTLQVIKNCKIGKSTKVWNFVNLYGCEIGENCMIGAFVEITENVKIGNFVRIQSHSFICSGVTIENNVFIGHGVMFINDKYPKVGKQWELMPTRIKENVSIGSNATILGGITIGKNSIIGAGCVVTKDVPENVIIAGNPGRILRQISPKF